MARILFVIELVVAHRQRCRYGVIRLGGAACFMGGSTDVVLVVAASNWAMLAAMVRLVQPLDAAEHFVIPEKLQHSTTKNFSVSMQDPPWR